MNWLSVGIVAGILFVSGFVISLLSTQLQCSKIGVVTSLKEGGIFASVPTLVYGLATYFESVRNPFKNTLESFGISAEASPHMAVGYLVMITCWITSVWIIHSTEKAVCVADVQEMTTFKKKLMAELQEKQEQEEKNKEAK